MAKNKTDLFALINTNIQDNTTKDITAAEMREVETQNADSALNVLEPSAQTVAGPVNFSGLLQNGGKNVLVGAKETEVLRAFSTAASQTPTALNTPIQIEFGSAQKTGSDPVMLASNGLLTVNQTGTYALRIKLQNGRVGAAGVSYLFSRIMKGLTQVGVSQCVKLSSTDSLIPTDSRVVVDLLAGDTVYIQMVRDSAGGAGNNSGGVYAQSSDPANGWALSPSALLVVSRIDGITS